MASLTDLSPDHNKYASPNHNKSKMNPLERDRDMVRSPDKWPAFPLLPLKHRWRKFNDDDSFGFILAGDPCKVYVARMYFAILRLSGKKTWAEAVKGMTTQHYPSVEALTDDRTVE